MNRRRFLSSAAIAAAATLAQTPPCAITSSIHWAAWSTPTSVEIKPQDIALANDLLSCTIDVRDDGRFDFRLTHGPSNFSIFKRGDPHQYEVASREAWNAL